MQNNPALIETFKYEAMPTLRTPSRSLILPATPIPEVSEPTPLERSQNVHRAQYDAVLTDYKPRDFRAFLMLSWLVFLACWFVFLLIAWRWL